MPQNIDRYLNHHHSDISRNGYKSNHRHYRLIGLRVLVQITTLLHDNLPQLKHSSPSSGPAWAATNSDVSGSDWLGVNSSLLAIIPVACGTYSTELSESWLSFVCRAGIWWHWWERDEVLFLIAILSWEEVFFLIPTLLWNRGNCGTYSMELFKFSLLFVCGAEIWRRRWERGKVFFLISTLSWDEVFFLIPTLLWNQGNYETYSIESSESSLLLGCGAGIWQPWW